MNTSRPIHALILTHKASTMGAVLLLCVCAQTVHARVESPQQTWAEKTLKRVGLYPKQKSTPQSAELAVKPEAAAVAGAGTSAQASVGAVGAVAAGPVVQESKTQQPSAEVLQVVQESLNSSPAPTPVPQETTQPSVKSESAARALPVKTSEQISQESFQVAKKAILAAEKGDYEQVIELSEPSLVEKAGKNRIIRTLTRLRIKAKERGTITSITLQDTKVRADGVATVSVLLQFGDYSADLKTVSLRNIEGSTWLITE